MSEQIGVAIGYARQLFEPISDSAKLDAELLLVKCLQKPRSYLYSWPEKTLPEKAWSDFQKLVEQRLKPTPIAYLLGEREFYSLSLQTSPEALIPRPETELLVETTLQLCADRHQPRILEMGTGTGAISIVLLREIPDIELVTTDISAACLALAKKNAEIHSVTLNCIESNWYDNLNNQARFDLIVSNPPYIAADDPYLLEGDLPAEPLLALTPGHTGLEAISPIIEGAGTFLKPGGYLIFEHGCYQAQQVVELLKSEGFGGIQTIRDDSGQPRISLGQLPQ